MFCTTPCARHRRDHHIPGLVNVDFEDVKTVMGEQGKAMMGTATATVSIAPAWPPKQAVASPLLEGVDLSGPAACSSISPLVESEMKETREVMNTIRAFPQRTRTVISALCRTKKMGDNRV